MSAGHEAAEEHAVHVHSPPQGFIWKYVFSTDHKVIGKQYFLLAMASVVIGLTLSLLFRYHLMAWTPQNQFLMPDTYLQVLTMHGTILVFMVLTTAPLGGFGNYILPIQIGAEDMAFPRLNMLSFWLTLLSWVVLMVAFFVPGDAGGPPVSGWTGYAPLSAINNLKTKGMGLGQSLWVGSIAIFCLASLVGAINFIVTILDLRCKGMSLMRMPLPCHAWFVTAILALLSFAVLLAGGMLLLLDRHLGTSFFIPTGVVFGSEILNHKGGSPLLWQHLFWFFGHPEVYIAILPGMGIVSHILANFARKPIFGYTAMVIALNAIAAIGFVVWGHHMFQSGMSPYTAVAFSVITMTIGVPSAIKTFNWLGTLWGGTITCNSAMLYSLGFVSLFVSGGISGIFLGQNAVDIYFHDTWFVVAHFHLIMGVAALFSIAAGSYYWFPKMYGRMMNETLGKLHFWLTFVGAYSVFIPMHILGMWGHPRRFAGFDYAFLQDPMVPSMQAMITYAAFMAVLAQLIFIFNFFWSMFKGALAGDNPWNGTSLEWSIPSPPPFDNFAGKHPVVNHDPYEYSVPGAAKDYIMQTDPPEARPTDVPKH